MAVLARDAANMKILYVTDLHGNEGKYEKTLAAARARGVDAVVNGGDMYPKNIPLEDQHGFITGFLDAHFARYERAGIPLLCMPGNDDLAAFDELFDATCRKHEGVRNIAQRRVELGGREFIGFNWVADYPFRLKDRCRIDSHGCKFPPQLGPALVSEGSWPDFGGLRQLDDWRAHARSLPTLEDEIARLPRPADPARAVYVIHMPPSGLGLDVCADGRGVGSEAVQGFLLATQPLLSLHGHIHESPDVTGVWKARVGRTIALQPGQTGRLTYVAIDLGRVVRTTSLTRPGRVESSGGVERIVAASSGQLR